MKNDYKIIKTNLIKDVAIILKDELEANLTEKDGLIMVEFFNGQKFNIVINEII